MFRGIKCIEVVRKVNAYMGILNRYSLRKQFSTKNNDNKPTWLQGFDKLSSIFIHVPKAAGTSISLALYGEDPWHYTADDYRREYPKQFEKYFTFAFVRNPFDRLLSTYLYSFVQKERHPTTSVAFVTEYTSFEQFILDWINIENVNSHYFFYPQLRYLTDESGRMLIDYLGRMETIAEDYQFVRARLGADVELEQRNKTEHKDYQSYYTPEMIQLVEDVYGDDLKLFGYRF